MRLSPNIALVSTTATVGASTAVLPVVAGYGTWLSQLVVLGAWSLVAGLTSEAYADQHEAAVWVAAFVLNVLLFFVPAVLVWLAVRKRWPHMCSGLLVTGCVVYLASLFVLFPASDGP